MTDMMTRAIASARRIASEFRADPAPRLILLAGGVSPARVPVILDAMAAQALDAAEQAESTQNYNCVVLYANVGSAEWFAHSAIGNSDSYFDARDIAAVRAAKQRAAERKERNRPRGWAGYDPLDVFAAARRSDMRRAQKKNWWTLTRHIEIMDRAISGREPGEVAKLAAKRGLRRLANRYSGSIATMLRVPETRGVAADVLIATRR